MSNVLTYFHCVFLLKFVSMWSEVSVEELMAFSVEETKAWAATVLFGEMAPQLEAVQSACVRSVLYSLLPLLSCLRHQDFGHSVLFWLPF